MLHQVIGNKLRDRLKHGKVRSKSTYLSELFGRRLSGNPDYPKNATSDWFGDIIAPAFYHGDIEPKSGNISSPTCGSLASFGMTFGNKTEMDLWKTSENCKKCSECSRTSRNAWNALRPRSKTNENLQNASGIPRPIVNQPRQDFLKKHLNPLRLRQRPQAEAINLAENFENHLKRVIPSENATWPPRPRIDLPRNEVPRNEASRRVREHLKRSELRDELDRDLCEQKALSEN